jgi:hypothetical protein
MLFRRKIAGAALSLSLLLGGGGVFAAQVDQYDHITDDMTVIRDLELLKPIDINYQTRQELQEWAEDVVADYTEDQQAADERVLLVFGLIEPGTDVGEMNTSYMSEGILGFYDPETKEMVVVLSSDGEELTANDQVTYAHEVVHALQDQHFDMLDVYDGYETMSDDRFMALEAMTEGDASLAHQLYLIENPGLMEEYEKEIAGEDYSGLDDYPMYFIEAQAFPYIEGTLFVLDVYVEGGWEAVNDMYQNPPTTSEQILHPEKFMEGEEAVDVVAADPLKRLGEGWEVFDDNVMGEFMTDVFLRNGGARTGDARDASEGWGGDNYIVFGNDEETGFVWTSAWDTKDDAEEFFATLVETESERLEADVEVQSGPNHVRIIGEDYVGEVELDGDHVTYTLTMNIDTLDTVVGNSPNDG